jgi:hypothetical protein
MQQTRREILDDFLQFVGESEDSDARNVAERLLNKAVTAIWLKHPWSVFRLPQPLQVTQVVNQARYSLPDMFGRVGPGEVRNITRGVRLEPLRAGDRERFFPYSGTSLEVAAQSFTYDIAGMSGVATQPASTGEALEVVSDDNADVDVKVAIAGQDSSHRWFRKQVTLMGTTAVAIGTWAFIDEFGKAYVSGTTPATELTSSRGTVTLRKASDHVTELQSLFSQESSREHAIFTLYPMPSAADVLAIPVIRKPKRLLYDADVIPELWEPAVWEELLINWQVNRGVIDAIVASQAPRPLLVDLIAHENAIQPRPRVRPYTRV